MKNLGPTEGVGCFSPLVASFSHWSGFFYLWSFPFCLMVLYLPILLSGFKGYPTVIQSTVTLFPDYKKLFVKTLAF